jgi:hypothetical protein
MQKRLGMVLMLAVLCLAIAVPAHAWYGYRGYYRGPSVVVVPRVVVPFGPYWAPYYPPVVVDPPPVYVAPPAVIAAPPPAPQYWYYCDNPRGYYPHVSSCPGGWRAVTPTPAQ